MKIAAKNTVWPYCGRRRSAEDYCLQEKSFLKAPGAVDSRRKKQYTVFCVKKATSCLFTETYIPLDILMDIYRGK